MDYLIILCEHRLKPKVFINMEQLRILCCDILGHSLNEVLFKCTSIYTFQLHEDVENKTSSFISAIRHQFVWNGNIKSFGKCHY